MLPKLFLEGVPEPEFGLRVPVVSRAPLPMTIEFYAGSTDTCRVFGEGEFADLFWMATGLVRQILL